MATENILETIIAHKRAELSNRPTKLPVRRRRAYSFRGALAKPGTRFILECKRASPSAGKLHDGISLTSIVDAYRGVADAVSVLTDSRFFDGSLDDLAVVARQVKAPVLRKDFILDPLQVREAHAYGADAVLLMLSVLDDTEWRACANEAARAGLDVLTEVHDAAELERALTLDAAIIGINNRSFADLSVDLDVTCRLAPRVTGNRVVVCESGIRDHGDVRALAPYVNAFLVGSALMRAPRTDFAARQLAHGEIKICGLTRGKDARTAWRAGARWGGVVFAESSPRHVTASRAREIAAASPLPLVGVFVDAEPALIGKRARELALAAVQLHGAEDRGRIAAARRALPDGCALWKAVRGDRALPALANVDRVVFDGPMPGSGKPFDWSLLPAPEDMRRHGLAGGITAGNVAIALATGAGMLDVGSGVESAPGIKSTEKLDQFFNAVRIGMRFRAGAPQAEHAHEIP